jgi:hypothetical protein
MEDMLDTTSKHEDLELLPPHMRMRIQDPGLRELPSQGSQLPQQPQPSQEQQEPKVDGVRVKEEESDGVKLEELEREAVSALSPNLLWWGTESMSFPPMEHDRFHSNMSNLDMEGMDLDMGMGMELRMDDLLERDPYQGYTDNMDQQLPPGHHRQQQHISRPALDLETTAATTTEGSVQEASPDSTIPRSWETTVHHFHSTHHPYPPPAAHPHPHSVQVQARDHRMERQVGEQEYYLLSAAASGMHHLPPHLAMQNHHPPPVPYHSPQQAYPPYIPLSNGYEPQQDTRLGQPPYYLNKNDPPREREVVPGPRVDDWESWTSLMNQRVVEQAQAQGTGGSDPYTPLQPEALNHLFPRDNHPTHHPSMPFQGEAPSNGVDRPTLENMNTERTAVNEEGEGKSSEEDSNSTTSNGIPPATPVDLSHLYHPSRVKML